MGRWGVLTQVVREALMPPQPIRRLELDATPGAVFATSYQPMAWFLESLQNVPTGPVSRDMALEVAAVQRARNQICSIATLPVHTYRGLDVDDVRHPLLRQIDPNVPNVVTLAATFEDLLFEGVAWWEVTATDFDGYPIAARHVPVACVSLQAPPGSVSGRLPSGIDPGRPETPAVWLDGRPAAVGRGGPVHCAQPGRRRA